MRAVWLLGLVRICSAQHVISIVEFLIEFCIGSETAHRRDITWRIAGNVISCSAICAEQCSV